jgi:hypothetical protein
MLHWREISGRVSNPAIPLFFVYLRHHPCYVINQRLANKVRNVSLFIALKTETRARNRSLPAANTCDAFLSDKNGWADTVYLARFLARWSKSLTRANME